MSDELLAKEKEFHRLNRELEQKTRELMKEVDSVMNIHGNCKPQRRPSSGLIEFERPESFARPQRAMTSANGRQVPVGAFRKNASLPQISKQPTQSSTSQDAAMGDGNDEEIMPVVGNEMGNEAIVRFLKAKTRMLHNELQAIQLEYKKKCNYSKELEGENKKLVDAREKWQGQATSLRDTLNKIETTNTTLRSKLQTRDTENLALKKEIDGLKKELKTINHHSSNFDVRLNRSLEDNERLRNALKFSQLEEKELRDHNRKLQEDKRIAIRNLEKQRSELLQAFKKQMLLIDNLKKQKAHLEAGRQIQFTEEEFTKLLDWKPDYL